MLVMHRREFLGAMAAAPLAITAQPASQVRRTFEIITRVDLDERQREDRRVDPDAAQPCAPGALPGLVQQHLYDRWQCRAGPSG